jgi:putative membrane protein
MSRFLVHWMTIALSLYVCQWIVPGVAFASPPALLVAAIVLGFVNAVLRPVLVVLTFPVTVLTIGLFYFVVNGIAFYLASLVVPGFHIASFGSAVLGALVVSLVSWFIGLFTGPPRRRPFDDRLR